MNKCTVCGELIGEERLEALKILETPEHFHTCIKCAPNNFNRGVWLGTSGNSPLVIASKLSQDRMIRVDANNLNQEDK